MFKKSGALLLGCAFALATTNCSLSPNAEPKNRLNIFQADIDLKTLPENPEPDDLMDLPSDRVKGLEETMAGERIAQAFRIQQEAGRNFRWLRRGNNWIPYRYYGGRYHPHRVFRNGRYYRVVYIFVSPNYVPRYIPDEGPIYLPWENRVSVAIRNYSFMPSSLQAVRGTTVTWVNRDSVPHTVTANSPGIDYFDSGVLSPGNSYSHTFNLNGSYAYHCRLHPYMNGEVDVGNR
ncbi:MAG TPA: hypothetical protein DD435_06670 [Cyanobacteria bacterium UBA8530]|nr:hypothetical protein [Cyanobacteria bacterium UBA8530]